MDITIHTLDETIDVTVSTDSNDELIDIIRDKVDVKRIKRIDSVTKFMNNNKYSMKLLEYDVEKFTECSSTKIKIDILNDFFFSVTITGTLGDVLGAWRYLKLNSTFTTYERSIKTDINIIKSILGNNSHMHNFDESSILSFLSEHNGGITYSNVFTTLNKGIKKKYVKNILEYTFNCIYGKSIEKAKHELANDKLTLDSIDDVTISDIGKELNRRLINVEV